MLGGQGDTHLGFKFAVEDPCDDPIYEWVTSSFCILATDVRNRFPFLDGRSGPTGRGEALLYVMEAERMVLAHCTSSPPQTLELHQGKVENGPKYTFILGRHFPLFSGVKCGSQD